jgi:hypothetical protein
MSTWFKMLNMELDEITEYVDDGAPKKENETVIGEMSDEHKKLYTLWRRMQHAADIKATDLNYTSHDKRPALILEAAELGMKAETLQKILWTAIGEDLHTWDKQNLSIRQGWIVVEFPIDQRHNLLRMLNPNGM